MITQSLSVLLVGGLAGHAQGVADLLPRPPGDARRRYCLVLDLLGKPAQREDGAQPHRGVFGAGASEVV